MTTTERAPWHDVQCTRCRLHFECIDAAPQTLCFWCREPMTAELAFGPRPAAFPERRTL